MDGKVGWQTILRSPRFRLMVALLLSATVLILLALKIHVRFDRLIEEWRNANKSLLCAAFAYSAFWHLFIGADKWWRILRTLGTDVRYWEVFRVRLGSDPIRFVSPFKTGEIIQAAYFPARGKLTFGRSVSSILFDKVLNYLGTWFWFFIGLVVLGTIPWMWQLSIMILAAGGMAIVIISERFRSFLGTACERLHPKLRRFAEGTLSTFREFSWSRKAFFLLYGIVFQIRPLLVCYLLFLAFGAKPGLREILTYGSVAVLMSNVPLTTAGIGPRETAIALLFARYGSQEMLFSVGILMSVSIFIIPAILGLPLMPALLRTGLDGLADKPLAPGIPMEEIQRTQGT